MRLFEFNQIQEVIPRILPLQLLDTRDDTTKDLDIDLSPYEGKYTTVTINLIGGTPLKMAIFSDPTDDVQTILSNYAEKFKDSVTKYIQQSIPVEFNFDAAVFSDEYVESLGLNATDKWDYITDSVLVKKGIVKEEFNPFIGSLSRCPDEALEYIKNKDIKYIASIGTDSLIELIANSPRSITNGVGFYHRPSKNAFEGILPSIFKIIPSRKKDFQAYAVLDYSVVSNDSVILFAGDVDKSRLASQVFNVMNCNKLSVGEKLAFRMYITKNFNIRFDPNKI